jgi:hypothetical protein
MALCTVLTQMNPVDVLPAHFSVRVEDGLFVLWQMAPEQQGRSGCDVDGHRELEYKRIKGGQEMDTGQRERDL